MTPRATAALSGILILLCAAYFLAQRLETRQERRIEEAKRIFTFSEEDVAELAIRQVGQPKVRASRSAGGAWDLVEPNTTIQPLQPLWNRVAAALANLPSERTLGTVESPAEYGLDEPALEVRATLRDGGAIAVDFGFEEPTRTFRYARLGDGTVFLVRGDQYFELNRSLTDLRHRFLVDDRESPPLRFEFARVYTGGGEMSNPPPIGTESVLIIAERPDAGSPWRLTSPIAAPADQDVLGSLVDELRYAVTEGHIDRPESLTDYGLEPPQVRVTLTDAGGEPQTIHIGHLDASRQDGRVFARRTGEDAVFLLDSHMLSLFPRSPHGLRERRLFTQPVTGLTGIDLVVRGETVRLRRPAEGAWRLAEPDEEADPIVVSNLVGGLKDLFAMGFPDETSVELGLDNPDFAATLHFAAGDPVRLRFRLSPRDAAYHYGEQSDGTPVLMETARLERLMLRRADFRSRELLRFDARLVTGVALQFEGVDYRFEKVHDRWVVRAPEDKILSNQSDVDVLVRAFTPLVGQGDDDVAPPDGAATGLDAPLCRFEATLRAADGTEQQVGPVLIGLPVANDPMRRHAAVPGRPGSFRIKQEIVELIRESLRGVVDPPQ